MSYVFGFALEKKTLRFKLLKVQLVDMHEGSHLLIKRPIFDICQVTCGLQGDFIREYQRKK